MHIFGTNVTKRVGKVGKSSKRLSNLATLARQIREKSETLRHLEAVEVVEKIFGVAAYHCKTNIVETLSNWDGMRILIIFPVLGKLCL